MLRPMRPSTLLERPAPATEDPPEPSLRSASTAAIGEQSSGIPVGHGRINLLEQTTAADADGSWGALATAISLAGDPGAAAPLIEALDEVLDLPSGNDAASAAASLRQVVTAVMTLPAWLDGSWRRSANPSRRGGRHTGNVQDHPLLSCLLADRRATLERPALNRLRWVMVVFLAQGGEPTGAVVTVADAVRKAESMEAWRQVVRAMPCPGEAGLDLGDWMHGLVDYLDQAEPPSDLAMVPAVSIRAFFAGLKTLIRHVTAQPTRRQQRRLFDDDLEPRGTVLPLVTPKGRSHSARQRVALDDPVVDRRRPVQHALVFDDDAQDDGAASVPLVAATELAPLEQPLSNRAARLGIRLGSYRLTEINQRLRWSWDHLNSLDIAILTTSIRLDSASPGARWRGGVLCAVMLGLGRSTADALRLGVGVDTGGDDWIDAEWRWHRRIRRPPKAWVPDEHLLPQLVTSSSEIALHMPPLLRDALTTALDAAGRPGELGALLHVSTEEAPALLSEWLQPLRQQHPSARLTSGRIARAFAVEVFAVAGQELAVHALTGTEEHVPPVASYYVALDTGQLAEATQQAWARLFGDEGDAKARDQSSLIGAPVLQPAELADWVGSLRLAVASGTSLAERHNSYCRYVLLHLLAATGMRPVNDPFESLDMLDLPRSLALVADKSSHQPNEARLVPLTAMTVALVTHWRDHLQRLARWVNESLPMLSLQIETTLHATGPRALPLFFVLDDDLTVQRIDRSTIEAWWPTGWTGLPANQLRRELATAASNGGWPAELVEQLLGHVDLGVPAFGAQSSLSPVELQRSLPGLAAMLERQGWSELASPLDVGPTRRGRPLPRFAAATATLGSTQRSAQQAASSRRTLRRMEEVLRRWCRGRDWRALPQADVDILYRESLCGRMQPGTAAEVIGLQRIDRLLRWLKRRHGLQHLRLPASRALHTAPVPHATGDLQALQRWQQLRQAFERLLHQRARRAPELGDAGRLAEAVVGAALYSFICERRVLHALAQPGAWCLREIASVGVFLELKLQWPGQGSATQRLALQPMSALLLGRVARAVQTIDAQDRTEYRRALHRLLNALARQTGGGVESFGTADAAERWLCETTATAAWLRLPGHLVAVLDGRSEAVSLPVHDWTRWMAGHDPPAGASSDPVQLATEFDPPDRPAARLRTCDMAVSEAAARAHGLALHRHVREIFSEVDRLAETHAEEKQKSLNRIEALVPRLEQAIEQHASAPDFAVAVVQWLVELLRSGATDRALRSSSADRYYTELAGLLIDQLSNHTLADLDEDTLADAYAELLEALSPGRQPYALGRLREFHRFLVQHHGVPDVDWSEVTPEGLERHHAPDAGVLLWAEYQAALKLLADDASADLRERRLQAVVLLLMFRAGLRSGECLGLRAADLICHDGQWIVLVRCNAYRNLKSDAGVRQVPLIGPLDALEVELLEGWRAHADETVGNDRCGVLIGRHEAPRRLIDRQRLLDRITDALRAVTGRAGVRPHHLRHTFASRTALLLCLRTLPGDETVRTIVQRLVGPCDPEATRRLLLDTDEPSKRALWALSLAIGHASPATTLRWYVHVHELLQVLALHELEAELAVRLDTVTAAYTCGQQVRRSRHLVTVDGAWASRHFAPGAIEALPRASMSQPTPALSPRRASPSAPPEPLAVDRLLEQVHRRSRVDGLLAHRLMLRPEVIGQLLQQEFHCRESAGYDLTDSGWHPSSSRAALRHARAGIRSPAETERVRGFLRQMSSRLDDPIWRVQAHAAVAVWQRRYRATATPVIVTTGDEAAAILTWCEASGVRADDLIVMTPDDGCVPADADRLTGRYPTVRAPLAAARAQYRGQGRTRLGVQLRENEAGPLTQMTQLHRVLHVIATWLATTEQTKEGT
jgi:integrase